MAQKLGSFLLLFTLVVHNVSGNMVCLYCSMAVTSSTCERTKTCGPHEICYSDAYVTPNGNLYYELGCRDPLQCSASKRRDLSISAEERSTDNTEVCSECCRGDLCNSGMCGQTGFLPVGSRGPICFTCDQQLHPGSCNVISQCSRDEVCAFIPAVGTSPSQTRCMPSQECHNKHQGALIIFGRRRSGDGCHVLECCDQDVCNNYCNQYTAPVTKTTTATTTTVTTAPTTKPTTPTTKPTTPTTKPTTPTTKPTTPTTMPTTPTTKPTTPTTKPTTPTTKPTTPTTKPTTPPTTTRPTTVHTTQARTCEHGWIGYGASCYFFSGPENYRFTNAKAQCAAQGGYLAEINDQQEERFLKQTVEQNYSYYTDFLWIGLEYKYSYVTSSWNWVWLHSNTVASYTNFNDRYPNYANYAGALEKTIDGWRSISTSNSAAHYICERDL